MDDNQNKPDYIKMIDSFLESIVKDKNNFTTSITKENIYEFISEPYLPFSKTTHKSNQVKYFKSIKDFNSNINSLVESNVDIVENGDSFNMDSFSINNNSSDHEINETEDGTHYVVIPVDNEGNSIRLFINQNENVPESAFLYDYFGSGEIFVNVPADKILTGAKEKFAAFYRKNFMGVGSSLKTEYPSQIGVIPNSGSGTSYPTPSTIGTSNPTYGWLFGLETYFNLEDSNSVPKIVDPICKYYSYSGKNKSENIISSEYNFANHIENYPSCSCAAKTGSPKSLGFCEFPKSCQTSCRFYSPLSETVSKVVITPNNSDQSIEFETVRLKLNNGNNLYRIINVSNLSVVNQIEVPSEVSEGDANKQVSEIFNEYISCYLDHQHQNINLNTNDVVEKNSFIQTLLEV